MIVFETQNDYYKWLNEPEQDIQDTVYTALEYIAQLHEQINIGSGNGNEINAKDIELVIYNDEKQNNGL